MNEEYFNHIKPVVISAVIMLNITLNVTVIAVIVKYPQLRQDRTTLFILSLTISDLASGCTAMPISAAVCSDATPNARYMTRYLPKILLVCSVWFNISSMHSLCWVVVCEMFAITHPLRYEQVPRNRCYIIIASSWLIGAIFAASLLPLSPTFNLDMCIYDFDFSTEMAAIVVAGLVVGFVLPTIAIVYATAIILRIIVRTHYRIK